MPSQGAPRLRPPADTKWRAPRNRELKPAGRLLFWLLFREAEGLELVRGVGVVNRMFQETWRGLVTCSLLSVPRLKQKILFALSVPCN